MAGATSQHIAKAINDSSCSYDQSSAPPVGNSAQHASGGHQDKLPPATHARVHPKPLPEQPYTSLTSGDIPETCDGAAQAQQVARPGDAAV